MNFARTMNRYVERALSEAVWRSGEMEVPIVGMI